MIGSDGWNGYDNTPPMGGGPAPMENDPMEMIGDDGENLAQFAFIFGVAALGTTFLMSVYLPYIFAPLAIVFAVIAQGRRRKLSQKCKRAIMLASLALIANTVILCTAMIRFFTDEQMRTDVSNMMESMYGVNLEELMGEMIDTFKEPENIAAAGENLVVDATEEIGAFYVLEEGEELFV